MTFNPKEFQLGEQCTIQSSKRIFAREYVENGIPFLRSKDVIDKALGVFSHYDLFISEARFREIQKTHGSPKKGDILISSVGNRAGQAYVIQDEGEFHFKDGNILWLSDFDNINSKFLTYWFSSPVGQKTLASVMIGSAQKALTIDALRKLWVQFPSVQYQNFAIKILCGLDEKIAINKKINQTLEQMAQAIFKSWFVDFEPVKAKIASLEAGGSEDDALLAAMQIISGKDPQQLTQLQTENPEHYATLRATAELFPAAMQESELGEIPEGWEASTVGAEFDVTMGQSPPGSSYNETGEGSVFFQGRRDFGVRFPSNRVYCTEPKRMAKQGDTLLSVRAPVGDVNIASTNCCIGRGLAAIRHKTGCSSFTYYSVIHLGHALASYDSEGTVFGSINQKNLNSLLVVAPTKKTLEIFSNIVGKLDDRIKAQSNEMLTLAQLRDTLLPKLLSGQLSVNQDVD